MRASAHERYRERLEALAGDGALLAALGVAPGLWERRSARFDPGRSPYATLVLEAAAPQRLLLVEAFASRPHASRTEPVPAGPLGFVVATAFPRDAGLPTLPAVLAEAEPATVVRYHPARRCTLRAGSLDRYAKVFTDGRGHGIHATGIALWEAGEAGRLGFHVARPERYDAATRALWQRTVPGTPVGERLLAGDTDLARRIGAAAATVARSGVRPRAVLDARAQLDRAGRHCDELADRVPAVADLARRVLDRLGGLHAAAAERPLVPIHGAPHVGQWLDHDGRLALVDFDRASLGRPEHDAATLLADLDFEDADRVPVGDLQAAVVAGFEEAVGPLDPPALAACRAQWHVAKALRAARSVRPDGDRRAERRLRRAARLVEGARA